MYSLLSLGSQELISHDSKDRFIHKISLEKALSQRKTQEDSLIFPDIYQSILQENIQNNPQRKDSFINCNRIVPEGRATPKD